MFDQFPDLFLLSPALFFFVVLMDNGRRGNELIGTVEGLPKRFYAIE